MRDSFFFNDTATTEIYTLSLHDALPICLSAKRTTLSSMLGQYRGPVDSICPLYMGARCRLARMISCMRSRSAEHTSELQSRQYLVCRLMVDYKLAYQGGPRPVAEVAKEY